jgi:hypothetical protein
MSEHGHIYGEIHNKTGMKRVFGQSGVMSTALSRDPR